MDLERRRRLVHLLIGINGAGFVLCGTFLPALWSEAHVPWFGLAGVAVLFVGVVLPFYREFMALRDGFDEVEREAKRGIRRRDGRWPKQMLIAPGAETGNFHRVRAQPLYALALTLVGWGLLAIEGVLFAF